MMAGLAAVAGVAHAGFVVRGDAVFDDATGLLWEKVPDNYSGNWVGARDYANNLVLAGKDDWRLPDIGELQTLYADIKA